MLGGGKFPVSVEENRAQCGNARLTELQLIGHVPIQSGGAIGIGNYVGNEHAPTDNRPIKRFREEEHVNMPQKLGVPLNSIYQDDHGHIGALVNPNHVSTGLRLFCDQKERSSSVNSACENMKIALPGVLSLGNTIKMEIDRQTEEFCQYIKTQEENILKGGRELNHRHTVSLCNALEKTIIKKLHEKELQIENINRKNKELEDKIKQVTMEAQNWHDRAKHNESVANVLKTNIQQLAGQGLTHCREGFGDSEVDDAVSCINQEVQNQRLVCRGCKSKQVSVLLFPCRHLCLCGDCEGLMEVCPVCQVMKTASFLVHM